MICPLFPVVISASNPHLLRHHAAAAAPPPPLRPAAPPLPPPPAPPAPAPPPPLNNDPTPLAASMVVLTTEIMVCPTSPSTIRLARKGISAMQSDSRMLARPRSSDPDTPLKAPTKFPLLSTDRKSTRLNSSHLGIS